MIAASRGGRVAIARDAEMARGAFAGPILVASDASKGADAALAAARVLGTLTGSEVSVVSVVEPLAFVGGGASVTAPDVYLPLDPALDAKRRDDQQTLIRDQMKRMGVVDPWEIAVREGTPAQEIAERAKEIGAGMLVVGLTHHSVLDRILGRERALNIVRGSHVPVLAVPGELAGRPERIVVGVDFTPASLDAARAAFIVASADAMVQLVHVRASETRAPDVLAEWHANYHNALDGGFALLESQIDVPPGVQLEHHAISGKVAQTLLARAEEWKADLVIVATHGGGPIRRLTTGSVTAQVIRQANRPVLVIPAR